MKTSTLDLNQIQERYESYHNHEGIQALNKAIDKVLVTGKSEYETGNGSIERQWINSAQEQVYNELIESRNNLIDKHFPDLKPLLAR